ncbi:MAG: signal peptidase I [Eubacteriales bacterium]|nr:signal peptidase I [Eubacteriales bacterium]
MSEQPGKPRAWRGPRHAPKKKNSVGREILEWVITLGVAVVVALLIHTFIGQPYTVLGPSMQPTLYTGERVILSKITYRVAEPQAGDIVVVKYPESGRNPNGKNFYIKRVVGVAGDVIAVKGGVLLRNGQAVEEPYLGEMMGWDFPETTVPAGSVFVMGDNRNNSTDSRSAEVGAIPLSHVVGKAYCIYWPLNRISSVYD